MDIAKTIVGVGIAGMVVFISLFIGATLYTEIPLSQASIANETWNTGATGTWVQLAHPKILAGSYTVKNAASVVVTETTDYILNRTDGTIQGQNTTALPQNTEAYIAYSYEYRPSEQTAVFNTFNNAMYILTVAVILVAVFAIVKIVAGSMGKRFD